MEDAKGSLDVAVLRTSLVWQGTKAQMRLDVEKSAIEGLWARIEQHAMEAVSLGFDFALGPIHSCIERPNISGHYINLKIDYMFVTPGDEAPAGWTLYETSKAQVK